MHNNLITFYIYKFVSILGIMEKGGNDAKEVPSHESMKVLLCNICIS